MSTPGSCRESDTPSAEHSQCQLLNPHVQSKYYFPIKGKMVSGSERLTNLLKVP